MQANALFFHHPASKAYKFNEDHPFNPIRAVLTMDLLKKLNKLPDSSIVIPELLADDSLLSLVHRPDYIDAVKQASYTEDRNVTALLSEKYGIGTEDTPHFSGIHHAASAIVSGSLAAADAVMRGDTLHAYHVSGGLHHAFPERAAGFCVYNDAAIAIEHIRIKYGARVLYIDTDVHHGDGVQWIFYNDPNVCTYSIHETGKFLFPGTGYVYEKGNDQGFGSCFNIPLEPYTEDDSWLESFNVTIHKVIEHFRPDVIVSQHGCDAHAFDPLSHLHCSMKIYHEIPAIIHRLAHEYTDGRWIALGGGGYDIWRVVPRAWSLVWLEMIDQPVAYSGDNSPLLLPDQWVKQWQQESPVILPKEWTDPLELLGQMPRRKDIEQKNRLTQSIAIQDIK